MADEILNEMLLEGDLEGVIAYVENWNEQPRNQQDHIVFRYMSLGEFDNRIHPDGGLAQALPFDIDGNLVVKYITPDLYVSAQSARASLSLPSAPDIAIWTYESQILQSKMPAGPGQYQKSNQSINNQVEVRKLLLFNQYLFMDFFPY